MQAGELDQRIAIEAASPVTVDVLGEEAPGWSPLAEVWAKIFQQQGREFLKGEYKAEDKIVFVIRWLEMDSTARVKWAAVYGEAPKIYRIGSVTGTRRDGFLYLHCTSDGETA